jgi:hypothetical protein
MSFKNHLQINANQISRSINVKNMNAYGKIIVKTALEGESPD